MRRNGKMMLCSFSQDMASIDNISFVLGNCQFWLDGKMRKAKGGGIFRDDVWYFLENAAVKKHLLKHMTDECFEQLVDSCLMFSKYLIMRIIYLFMFFICYFYF